MSLQDVALGITHLCVRNTVIEGYHLGGKLSDADMKVFNRQVVNRIYTFLDCLLNRSTREKNLFLGKMVAASEPFTAKWDEPEFDGNLWEGEKARWEYIRRIERMVKAAKA